MVRQLSLYRDAEMPDSWRNPNVPDGGRWTCWKQESLGEVPCVVTLVTPSNGCQLLFGRIG
eukprot:5225368-Pyramimonas_sp.AAC.1